jgi:hypothetical protein
MKELTQRQGRALVPFRNCFCGKQAQKFMGGMFLCLRHWEADRARLRQNPAVTAMNIRECNRACEKLRMDRLRAAGMCVTCGKREANRNATRCEPCQAKRRALQASYRGPKQSEIHPWRS